MTGWYGPAQAVDCVVEFLTSSDGARLSFNDELAAYNTARGLALPDVQDFHSPLILGSQCTVPGVNCGVEWQSFGPEDGDNARTRVHVLEVAFYVPAPAFDGKYDETNIAAMHYVNVAQGMWARATVPGTYGYTLNNGGSVAPGRVLRSEITGAVMGVESGGNAYNFMPSMTVTVQLIGDYPGT